jgi:hypothetical protein
VTDPYHSNIQKFWLRIPKHLPDTVPYKSNCDSLQLTKLLSRAEESTKQVLDYEYSDSSEEETVEAFTGCIPKSKPPPKWFLNYYPKLLVIYERSISKCICCICQKKSKFKDETQRFKGFGQTHRVKTRKKRQNSLLNPWMPTQVSHRQYLVRAHPKNPSPGRFRDRYYYK